MLLLSKFLQGLVMAALPPALNKLTQEISGQSGFTEQVSRNETAAHMGTLSLNVACGLLGASLYGTRWTWAMFAAPAALVAALAAGHRRFRGELEAVRMGRGFGVGGGTLTGGASSGETLTPEEIPLKERPFAAFLLICFLFHLVNAVALPLSMQAINKLGSDAWDNNTGSSFDFLLSTLCVSLSQACMVYVAPKVRGTDRYGRKPAFLAATFVLGVRCLLLSLFCRILEGGGGGVARALVLSMSALDGFTAGVFNVMFVLVCMDLAGPGRISSYVGMAGTAINLGGTLSGFIGEFAAGEIGYSTTFLYMGVSASALAMAVKR